MSVGQAATEGMSFDKALDALPSARAWIPNVLARLERIHDLRPGMKVLDVGAAQGRSLIALHELGYDAVGLEPWARARDVARQLGEHFDVPIDIHEGWAEDMPFEDDSFDLVLASSVVEHVRDVRATFAEVRRVLRPGGIFWFNTASAMSPRQSEILGFPGFGWYPDPVKVGLMYWARDHRPELVGHTKAPAIHWFTDRKAARLLHEAGFTEVWDRWDLRREDREGRAARAVIGLARRSRTVRRVANAAISGCSYAAR